MVTGQGESSERGLRVGRQRAQVRVAERKTGGDRVVPQHLVLPDGIDQVVCDVTLDGSALGDVSSVKVGNRLVLIPVRADLLDVARPAAELDSTVWDSLGRAGCVVRQYPTVPGADFADLPPLIADQSSAASLRGPSLAADEDGQNADPTPAPLARKAQMWRERVMEGSRTPVPNRKRAYNMSRSKQPKARPSRRRVAVELVDVVQRVVSGDSLSGRSVVRFDMRVMAGELLIVKGVNNPAARSLVNLLAGVEAADGGWVLHNGVHLGSQHDAEQFRRVLPGISTGRVEPVANLSVAEFVALPMLEYGVERIQALRESRSVLDELGRGACADQPLESLTAVDRSLVLSARALAGRRAVRMLVEPFRSLGHAERALLAMALRATADRGSAVVILSDEWPAELMPDRTMQIVDGELLVDNVA